MINYISSWAEQVIICIIAITVLEMILPKGNSKKYIKTIMGVYILYTIISPGIKLITGKDIKINYSEYEKYFDTQETYADIKQSNIEKTYKAEIEKQIKLDVENMGYFVSEVNIKFNLKEGIIKNIVINLAKEKKETNTINISINEIEIGNKTQNKNIDTEDTKKIKQKINESYGVDIQNITVNSI